MSIGALLAALGAPAAAVSFDQAKASWQPSDTLILDRRGELLHRLRTDATVRRGQWVALADVSAAFRTALLYSEDKRFYEHSGVDWQAVSSAAWANLWNHKTRGASTITMQLAGLLDDDLKRGAAGRSLVQKLGQTLSVQTLERQWRKDQILEAYLNLVPFRGELVGIDAMSQTLFGKAAHGLDLREAAVAAALVRAPNAKAALVAQRACAVLKAIALASPEADCVALDLFTAAALQRRDYVASQGIAPHLARQLLASRRAGAARAVAAPAAPATIETSLQAPLQRFAVQTLNRQLRELAGRHVEDGAIVVLDKASGEVLAWVGSSGDLSHAAEVDGVTALRQPGSTLKPFLYAQAIAERRITAASLLEDSSTQLQTSGGLYIPQNYDHQFKGWVSVRTALGASLNVPAVRTLVMVSPDAFHKQLVQLGLPISQSGGYYGYSLALGSAEVSLLNLTNAYRALANGGRYSQTTLIAGARTASRPAVDPRAAFIVGDILSDPLARARSFGTDSILATRFCRRHPERPLGACAQLWHRQHPGHPLLERCQDRDQQGHARQLGRRLLAALCRWRVGGQCQWRADVGCQRHHRCSADLGCGDEALAPIPSQPRACGTGRHAANAGAVCRGWRNIRQARAAGGRAQRVVLARH